MFNGKIHYKWSFSIATLVYRRVYLYFVDKIQGFYFCQQPKTLLGTIRFQVGKIDILADRIQHFLDEMPVFH